MNTKLKFGLIAVLGILLVTLALMLVQNPKQAVPATGTLISSAKNANTPVSPSATTPTIPVVATGATIQPTKPPQQVPTWTPAPTRTPAPFPTFRPTADAASPWLSFTDSSSIYSFQYPTGASVKEVDNTTIIQAPLSFPPQAWVGMHATIKVEPNESGLSLEQIYDSKYAHGAAVGVSLNPLYSPLTTTHQYLLHVGAEAVKAYVMIDSSYQILALHDSNLYVFNLSGREGQPPAPEEEELFDKIISSFRFLP